ncbi:BTAD domain-containing putative transcriptional regulator [Deinococcus cellulosilyticus]|uniref:Uncharacterized protein n=1 Tax=Deinococcus cellulosilyticus (strain DSM 18568 / NBRC 106333 / KACC 11606 / 5516J-15) TaxID=1223518 RepID=A0A511N2S0_DEIC1|nr:BTAD domain-containing putative transcriptional regulator [Deinococcus cellulosilyticus]GEM47149.1 hypothetical protein DC3_27840 [Deinococcus cellulosilyticus NBRC 106333 = KACC 11606]
MNTPAVQSVLQSLSWATGRLLQTPEHFFQILKVFLSDLRQHTNMDSAELFLASPQQTHLLLTSYDGKHRSAFLEKLVFRFGMGYPGIVAETRAPLKTSEVQQDQRYLRDEVKKLGYQSYVCYPLVLPHKVIGVINLASRSTHIPAEAERILSHVAPLLASSLYSVLTSLSEGAFQQITDSVHSGTNTEGMSTLLEQGIRISGGQCGVIHLLNGQRIESHPEQLPACSHICHCPAVKGRILINSIPGMNCEHQSKVTRTVCLPLWSGNEVSGVQTMHFSKGWAPSTQAVAPLLWFNRLAWQALAPRSEAAQKTADVPWLEIETFGAFRVKKQGQMMGPTEFGRRQAYLLLKILVSRWGRPITTEELLDVLWPEEDPDRALPRLHVVLNALRKAIEPDPAKPSVILRDGNTYRFAPEGAHHLDVERFEQLVGQADQMQGQEAIQQYRIALKLYKGDFMADEAYADWCALERNYLKEQAVRVMFRMADLLQELDQQADAQEMYYRILSIDPYQFDAYESLIDLLNSVNRVQDAQLCWEQYRTQYGEHPPIPRPA